MQATVPFVIVVALIAAVFVVVLVRVDVDLSGDLTSGDLLVGIGTLGLAWYTAQLAYATYKLDKRRHDRQVRGVARLVEKELDVVRRNARDAVREGAWPAWYATPHGAWDRDGAIIADTVSGKVAESLVVAFSYVGEWEMVVTRHFLLHPAEKEMSNDEESNKKMLCQLLNKIDHALDELRGAGVLPSGAEHADPDQGWFPRLRRLLFWPVA